MTIQTQHETLKQHSSAADWVESDSYTPDDEMKRSLAFLEKYGKAEKASANLEVADLVRWNSMVGKLVHVVFLFGVIREFEDVDGVLQPTSRFHPVPLAELEVLERLPTVAEQLSHSIAGMLNQPMSQRRITDGGF